ncbi:hypothetical protein AMAG_09988 [Allomyces macrogynus ATCC 38327]|uniref:Uncharacterized protein n=1 Tax=Allomyces macrogynus (strain ATCC 38327) TaxID=578462 RepID=A0A0L0SQ50_ALLM3|nr:hypothetical protein AMAG_09988 [Allomyces macrogynus ATCC 38327]|eukprot:KNE64632.1 hypothetical protein AMAG_09988 [Allomyces macrogynus ATCC 38327]
MFIYLSKKISIPNNVPLSTIAWENEAGWVACGGDQAMLKVLKLDVPASSSSPAPTTSTAAAEPRKPSVTGTAPPAKQAPASLSLSQTLEGHSGTVIRTTWNRSHTKLTTADSNGMIIVWILYKGMWYEEMVNDRAKAVVRDMRWNRRGDKIVIAYADGSIIIGGVEGNRILGKDVLDGPDGKEQDCEIAFGAWSPDDAFILFATSKADLRLFDAQGNYIHKVSIFGEGAKIIGIDWYNGANGYPIEKAPCLVIAFENGKLQLSRNERDQGPILVDTNLRHLVVKWNHNGSVLAVGGVQTVKNADGDEKSILLLQLYTPFGQYLRYLKIPGTTLADLTWEASGLRIALAVDSFIFFCNVHPEYKFAHVRSTLCYTYLAPSNAGAGDETVAFWDYAAPNRVEKQVAGLQFMLANRDHLTLVTRPPPAAAAGTTTAGSPAAAQPAVACVVNARGTPLDTRTLKWLVPVTGCMSRNHVVLSDGNWIAFFPYQMTGTASALNALLWQKESGVKLFHVESDGLQPWTIDEPPLKHGSNPVVSMACTDDWVVVARASGLLVKYAFPSMYRAAEFAFPLRPHRIHVNMDATKVSVMDLAGVLRMVEMTSDKQALLEIERKDVWDLRWSDDDKDLFAIMEKSRMYVMRGTSPEEPVPQAGYLAAFRDLEITVVQMDTVLAHPRRPAVADIVRLQTKSLRDTDAILDQVGVADAYAFTEVHPHPRQWRLVADRALETGEWGIAHKCLARVLDYAGILFLKRLARLNGDKAKQRAAILQYLGRVDQAELAYMDADRRDLAVQMRMAVGDWFRVVQMGKGSVDDAAMAKCWTMLGNEYLAQFKWTHAVTYFAQARHFDALADCYFGAEDVASLEQLLHSLPATNATLDKIGDYFARLGMAKEAVAAYVKRGNVNQAMQVCVQLNQWALAVDLAQQHQGAAISVDDLFAKVEQQVRARGDPLQLVALYRSANQCLRAANLLYELGTVAAKRDEDPLVVKKAFVMAALEVDRHLALYATSSVHGNGTAGGFVGDTAAGDIKGTAVLEPRLLEAPWRPAEAYHFYLLSQRQFHTGDLETALRTALVLRSYQDVLSVRIVQSLIAFLAFRSRNYKVCSRALSRLQNASVDADESKTYEDMAIHIFSNHPVTDFSNQTQLPCPNCTGYINELENACSDCDASFPACIASGRMIVEQITFLCTQCKHRALDAEIALWTCCPLCHSAL